MHDHVVAFRADLDICGVRNSLVRTSIEPLTRSYAWDAPEVTGPRNTMHMVHHTIKHETGLNWPRNSGEMFLVVGNETNKWGETRAYRVLPGTGMGTPSHLTIVNSTTLGRSAAWSAADLWVLKNHPDTEPQAAHHLNYLEPLDPLVDFQKMVDDNEPIQDEDLVVYFNLGGHHVPTSQDIPNTLMHTSASSVVFMPFNYFDDDVSRRSRQGVRIDRRRPINVRHDATDKEIRRSGSKSRVQMARSDRPDKDDDGISYFGARYTSPVSVPLEMLSPDLGHYMKDREDGQDDSGDGGGQWRTVRNDVGGGLLGLFFGREKPSSDNQDQQKGPRLDW